MSVILVIYYLCKDINVCYKGLCTYYICVSMLIMTIVSVLFPECEYGEILLHAYYT